MDFFNNFAELKATKKLEQLARTPYNLTAPNALSPERLAAYQVSACGLDFFYGTQRVDGQVMEALQGLADEAQLVAQFKAMKSGAIMNRIIGQDSEERQVLHTACRDLFTPPFCP